MKDIPGFEGKYLATMEGKIYSTPKPQNKYTLTLLKPTISKGKNRKDGYFYIKLGRKNNFSVHSLIAKTFLENTEQKPCINHIDGNKTNNNVTNLEWCTYSENNNHAHILLENKPWQVHAKKIGRFSLDGIFIDCFSSVKEAYKKVGGNYCAILQCARGEIKYSGNFIWKYLE